MQLSKSETVGLFDDHDRRVRNIDTDLDNSRRHQDLNLIPSESKKRIFSLLRLKSPVQQADRSLREIPFVFYMHFLGCRNRPIPLRRLLPYFGADNEYLSAGSNFPSDNLVNTVAFIFIYKILFLIEYFSQSDFVSRPNRC